MTICAIPGVYKTSDQSQTKEDNLVSNKIIVFIFMSDPVVLFAEVETAKHH